MALCARIAIISVGLLVFASLTFAQEPDITDTAPPPLRRISDQERKALDAELDVKRRTKLALMLMSARLSRAEEFSSKAQYAELYSELGAFHGLMDDTLAFLEKSDKDEDKVLSNFKRLEIGLRGFGPRLEVLRRDLPLRYEYYVRVLLRYLREARTRAVEPLFDDSVVKPKKTEEGPQ
jgi:hypothetical protein